MDATKEKYFTSGQYSIAYKNAPDMFHAVFEVTSRDGGAPIVITCSEEEIEGLQEPLRQALVSAQLAGENDRATVLSGQSFYIRMALAALRAD